MGIRLVVIDDNPHLTWEGRVHPANATFEHFVAALLDLPGSPVTSIGSCVPLRPAAAPPATRPLDPRIDVAGTAPFDGIAGYLHHAPAMLRANRPILRRAIAGADLVWIKVPASNAALAGALLTRDATPRFIWVAGSAASVGRARFGGAAALGAAALGLGYDLVGRAVGIGGHRLVVGEGLATGDGVVASLVEPSEIREPAERTGPPAHPPRLVWAGRLADGKGLEALIHAIAVADDVTLDLLGDGPARDRLAALAAAGREAGRVTFAGHVADRAAYLERLAAADAFVFPSPAEGFPKVVLDAMAAGLPVLATRAGSLGELLALDLIEPIDASTPAAIGSAWERHRAADADVVADRIARARAFVGAHTRPAEAAHLVSRWRSWWPDLPWDR